MKPNRSHTIPVPPLLQGYGYTRDQFKAALRAGTFRTEIPSGRAGIGTRVSMPAAFEIAVTATLARLGFTLTDARALLGNWLPKYEAGNLDRLWICNPLAGRATNEERKGKSIDALLSGTIGDTPTPLTGYSSDQKWDAASLVVVNLGEIARRLDEIAALYNS